ncbi:hypothetical protein EEL30_19930 [Brevibacillus laterosporus]|uniref:Uncharacterized protein n=1 Tax=Brevibacillus laterosporus TaxID=1465 RepID=A0A518VBH7_BRELA|nr:hypothetical protein EEL30_19930 [Brevibacillus laterosporus]
MESEIVASLQSLFDQAEKKGLWFYSSYHDIWLSPSKLRQEQENGKFLWGAVNWQLRDPLERVVELKFRRNQ